MGSSRLRVEFIRFGLLLTVTVALISVATRHDNHSASRNQATRGHHLPVSAAPSQSSSGQTSAPSEGGTTAPPSTSSPGTSTGGGSTQPTGSGAGGRAGHGGGTATSGTGGSDAGVATLPRTGGAQAVDLAGLAALFIAVGTFGVRISRPRQASAQAGAGSAAATQPGHACGSSESNRPGTF